MSCTKVLQTVFEAGKGNALQACVASALGFTSVDDVPNFIEDERGYLIAINEFLQPHGLSFLKIPLGENGEFAFPLPQGSVCLAAGKSPRGTHKHVVVSRIEESNNGTIPKIKLEHDPYPEGTGIDGSAQWLGFFVANTPLLQQPRKVTVTDSTTEK